MIDKVKYDEYCESLLNIARLTNKQNSVLINFDIGDEECSNVVSFIQQDGTKDILKNSKFYLNDNFYKEFLEVFVRKYSEAMVVAFYDGIDLNSDGKYTYRVVTDDNDLMSINGISLEYANYLMSITKRAQDNFEDIAENEGGVTTALATFILVGGIGMAFLVMAILLS